jgi:hypothetical protein
LLLFGEVVTLLVYTGAEPDPLVAGIPLTPTGDRAGGVKVLLAAVALAGPATIAFARCDFDVASCRLPFVLLQSCCGALTEGEGVRLNTRSACA